MNLVDEVYSLTKSFPREELFCLTLQIRRSAVPVPSNTAEGFDRKNTKEYVRFCYIALASLSELDTQIEIAYRQKYVTEIDKIQEKIIIIRKQLFALIKSLRTKL